MESEKAMKVVAVSDFAAFDYNVLLIIGVDVKGRPAEDVAHDIASIEEVLVVHLVSGKHDIEILVTLQDISGVKPLLLEKLSKVPGIRSLDSSIAVDIPKYEFDVAPI
jgi:DNA-binding Lrp family transcriptional regulator